MQDARQLIAAFLYLNQTNDRTLARFIPSLVGIFGSKRMLDVFLAQLDEALASNCIDEALKTRVENLRHTFVPQIAGLNSIKEFSAGTVTSDAVRAINSETPENRINAVKTILFGFMDVLDRVRQIES